MTSLHLGRGMAIRASHLERSVWHKVGIRMVPHPFGRLSEFGVGTTMYRLSRSPEHFQR